MKRQLFVTTSVLILLASAIALAGGWRKLAQWAGVAPPGPTADGKGAMLPTGWKITPAGRQVPLPGDMVMKIIVSPDGKTVFANTAGWHDHSVNAIDAQTGKVAESVNVGNHPNDLAYAKDGRLFVANAGSNSVSVIRGAKVVETIKTSFDPKAPVGSTPAALAITNDGKRLYVANADNNDLAVVDIANPRESVVLGFIPTTWYPSAVAVSPDGKKIFVGAGKGGLLNLNGNFPAETEYKVSSPDPKKPYDYVGSTLTGMLSIIDAPDKAQLAAYTAQVKSNFPNPEANVDKSHADRIAKEVFPKITRASSG